MCKQSGVSRYPALDGGDGGAAGEEEEEEEEEDEAEAEGEEEEEEEEAEGEEEEEEEEEEEAEGEAEAEAEAEEEEEEANVHRNTKSKQSGGSGPHLVNGGCELDVVRLPRRSLHAVHLRLQVGHGAHQLQVRFVRGGEGQRAGEPLGRRPERRDRRIMLATSSNAL